MTTRNGAGLQHARYYLSVIEGEDERYQRGGPEALEALGRFDREWLQVQAALDWTMKRSVSGREAADLFSRLADGGSDLLDLRYSPSARVDCFSASRDAAQTLGEYKRAARLSSALGWALLDAGEPQQAIEVSEKGLELARAAQLPNQELALTNLIGVAYQDQGQLRRAIEIFEQALEQANRQGLRFRAMNATGNLGLAYQYEGDSERAAEYHRRHLELARELKVLTDERNALNNLGLVTASMGDFDQAIELVQAAYDLSVALGDSRSAANEMGNLGRIYWVKGEYDRALRCHQEHLRFAEQANDRVGQYTALDDLGLLSVSRGDVKLAIEYYQAALELAQELSYMRSVANIRLHLAEAFAEMRELGLALQHGRVALGIFENLGHPDSEPTRKKVQEWQATQGG